MYPITPVLKVPTFPHTFATDLIYILLYIGIYAHWHISIHCEPKKYTKMFVSYLPQNPVDYDNIWYTLS